MAYGVPGSLQVLLPVVLLSLTSVAMGYFLGKRKARCEAKRGNNDTKLQVGKSFQQKNAVLDYCLSHSSRLHPVQEKLQAFTLQHPCFYIMGAREVIQLNANIILALGGKKVLDIGVYTGTSTLAAALALPDDGKVVACDTSEEFVSMARPFWREAGVEGKIEVHLQPASKTLDQLIAAEEEGTFDFAFIDADKESLDDYFEKTLQLLRKGGIMTIDNVLWDGSVLKTSTDLETVSIQKINDKICLDARVSASMLNVGDGITIAVKL